MKLILWPVFFMNKTYRGHLLQVKIYSSQNREKIWKNEFILSSLMDLSNSSQYWSQENIQVCQDWSTQEEPQVSTHLSQKAGGITNKEFLLIGKEKVFEPKDDNPISSFVKRHWRLSVVRKSGPEMNWCRFFTLFLPYNWLLRVGCPATWYWAAWILG